MFCSYNSIFIALVYYLFLNFLFDVQPEVRCGHNDTDIELPPNWPCDWNSGNIPYTFNFYLQNPNRLVSIIKRGIRHLEERSCLKFIEYRPISLAKTTNSTYIYFTYSDVLEDCCLPFFRNYTRRRLHAEISRGSLVLRHSDLHCPPNSDFLSFFTKHCVLSSETQCCALLQYQSEEMKTLNISFPRMAIESSTYHVLQSHASTPNPRLTSHLFSPHTGE